MSALRSSPGAETHRGRPHNGRARAVLTWRASDNLICNVRAAQGGGEEECSAEEKEPSIEPSL